MLHYIHRCEIPSDVTGIQQRLDVILNWILEHPNAVNEEYARREAEEQLEEERKREEELRKQQEIEQAQQQSNQMSAAEKFLLSINVRDTPHNLITLLIMYFRI